MALLGRLTEDATNPDLLQDFFQHIVSAGEIDTGRNALDQLQKRYPWNHHIRRHRIALSLMKKEYRQAMAAIETLMAFSTPDDGLIDSGLAVRNHIGPKSIATRTGGAPSLSLCMIVKNERAFLAACLNSVKHLVDEIIVIDTGSNDRSADIGCIYGARVYQFQWCDDFSAARNYSLEMANGDWILILDADESIAPDDADRLKHYLQKGATTPSAYSFQTRNYSNLANMVDWQPNDGSYPSHETGLGWFPTNKVRLFPRSRRIRFVYPVHELVDPSVRSAQLNLVKCPVPIHHYGYLNEKKRIQKIRHYFDLGYAKLDQLGNDPVALRELAIQAGQLERWPESIELWNQFLNFSSGRGEAYANLAGAHWQLGEFKLGEGYAADAIKADPDLKEGYYNLAVNQLFRGDATGSIRTLDRLLHKQPNYLSAAFLKAAALVLNGDLGQGVHCFRVLANKMAPQTVIIAIKDMIQRCAGLGTPHYAAMLEEAVSQIPDGAVKRLKTG